MNYFKELISKIKPKTKLEMWQELNGKTVKCFCVEDSGYTIFAVQDLDNKQLYFLDENNLIK